MAFRGHFEYTLDAKNRLTVPSKFRAALSDGIVLARALDPCVAIWTTEGWERFSAQSLGSRDAFDPDARTLRRFFNASSFDAQLDASGRVMIPPLLIEHAELKKDVVVIGNLDSIEVWSKSGWKKYAKQLDVDAEQAARRLSGNRDTSS